MLHAGIGMAVGNDTTWPGLLAPHEAQRGLCSVAAYDPSYAGVAVKLDLVCSDTQGDEYTIELVVNGREAFGDRLDFLEGGENLQVDFQFVSLWSQSRGDNVTFRDQDGTLLLAVTKTSAAPAPDGSWEGVEVGAPLEQQDDPSTWYAPFQRFVIRDGLCPDTDLDPSRGAGEAGWERRLAIEAETDVGAFRVFDRGEHSGIELSDGTYDFIVGNAYFLGATSCAECPPLPANFLVVRTNNENGGTGTGTGTNTETTGSASTTGSTGSSTTTSSGS